MNLMTFLNKHKKAECDCCEKTKMVTAYRFYLDGGLEYLRILCKTCWEKHKEDAADFKKQKVYIGRGRNGTYKNN